ncbi:MAG: CapA family protein [Coriobacteriia bacterium]
MPESIHKQRSTSDFGGFAHEWAGLEVRMTGVHTEGPSGTVFVGGDVCPRFSTRMGPGVFGDLAGAMQDAGATVVNLECPLTSSECAPPKEGVRLTASTDWALALRQAGVDAVGMANNHAMDAGAEGLRDTLGACQVAGIQVFGAGTSIARAREPVIKGVGGVRVALLAVAEHEFGIATEDDPGVAPMRESSSMDSVVSAKANADIVVLLVHGGAEQYPLPRPSLRETCHLFVQAGADLVVCQHSHVVGAVEVLDRAVIVYGTGNCFFPYLDDTPLGWNDSYSLSVDVSADGLVAVRLLPCRFVPSENRVRRLADEDMELFRQGLLALNARAGSVEKLRSEWSDFSASRRLNLLTELLGLRRPERALVARGIWPWWRMPRDRVPALLNVVRCESHRESLIEVLSEEIEG